MSRTAQSLEVVVGTATVRVTVDYGANPVTVTVHSSHEGPAGVFVSETDLFVVSEKHPAGWNTRDYDPDKFVWPGREVMRNLSRASREAHTQASKRWRVFRRRMKAANEAINEAIERELTCD